MKGRDGEPVTLLPLALVSALEDDAGVAAFQLEQRGPRSWQLHLGAECGPDITARCRVVLREFSLRQGLAPPRLQVHTDRHLAQGRSGKQRRIVAAPGAQALDDTGH
jgi:hypothetical protein